jgi:hypothetical protein
VVRGDIFGKEKHATHVFVDGRLFEPKEPARTPAAGRPGAPGTPQAPAADLPNVAGNYSVTINVPGQPIQATFAFTQQGALLTGTMQSELGTTPVRDGKVTAEGFTFSGTVQFGGSTIEILVRGSVTGNAISGTIDSTQGPVTFSGTRNP